MFFPGYIQEVYKAILDKEGNLNLTLTNKIYTLPDKFVSIDKYGKIFTKLTLMKLHYCILKIVY